MEKREYARSVLAQARELLSERLIDSIVDSADGILNDAEGLSYMSEIDDVQEQVLGRLMNVNQMIANFPPPSAVRGEQTISELLTASSTAEEQTPSVDIISPDVVAQNSHSFELFVQQVQLDEIDAAAQTLSDLLGLDFGLSHQCTSVFSDLLTEDPATPDKMRRLQTKLHDNQHNDCLVILSECFRLQGLRAIQVLHTLQNQTERAS